MNIIVFISPLLIITLSQNIITFDNSVLSFSRELIGIGFTKQLYTKISLKNPSEKAFITLIEPVPYTWFVDQEEVPDYLNPKFSSLIDIELPSSHSTNHTFTINLEITGDYEFTYPIHMRYNDPTYDVPYKMIKLPGPQIKYKENQIFTVNDEFMAEIPVGLTKHIPIVVMGTILLEIIAVFSIILAANKFTHHIIPK
ncbi:unnamed protein product [Blepharisma stoltei]|uniref:Protein PBN1 n=1 Tax=Blepharisma stoltei TaxID=1481888 RepID=A0AAU9KBB3_9CILI|nr:unnamed protein product [Blepharisma stoltei]